MRVGRSISLGLARHGYDIILIYNASSTHAQSLAAEVQALGRKIHLYECDLSDKQAIDRVFSDISSHDSIKLLVNNASIFRKYGFMETDEGIYNAHMDINLKAPFFLTQHFVSYVRNKGIKDANVINMLDSKINEVNTGHFIYHITKKALNDFTQMAAKALAPQVRVNSISLGKVLPSKNSSGDIDLDVNAYPRMAEINAAIIKLDSSSETGKNIIIESDKELL